MLRYHRPPSGRSDRAPERDLDRLALRIRRLVLHRGFDRDAIVSPLLKRQVPPRRCEGPPEVAQLRAGLEETGLDPKAIAYLIAAAESELDFARLRLT